MNILSLEESTSPTQAHLISPCDTVVQQKMAQNTMLNWQRIIEEGLHGHELPTLPPRIQIPRMPQCIAEFIQFVDRPDTPLSQLASLIEKDPEIASSLLRMVNGSQMMLKEKISSISRAIGLLGLQRCKMLVMSVAIQSSMSGSKSSIRQSNDYLLEAQTRALYAKRVAEILKVDADIAYISALLQDLLLPQLAQLHPKLYETAQTNRIRICEEEQAQKNWDHALMTASLLSQWNFAEEVIACVLLHHDHDTILADQKLLHSEVAAVALSGLLPGVLNQEPQGIPLLMQYQMELPEFDFLQVATDVDEALANKISGAKSRTSLAERLGRLAVAAMGNHTQENHWVEKSIGSYTLEEKIGQGGMGVVYRARHSMLRRPAAVKMLKSSTLSAHHLERFEIEAHITSELSSPHTVHVYDYGMTPEGDLYYVMEYLQGMSLAEIIAKHGKLSEGRIIHILCQVCGSLAEAHANGLIHRDIKPENIALTVCAGAYDFVKVLDFGLVAVKDEIPELAGSNKILGTPAYMSPEAIQSPDLVDERTDIYALGAVAYYCLTGEPLFRGRTVMDILQAQLRQTPVIPAGLCSSEFAELVLSCLEKQAQNRPVSMMAVVRALAASPESAAWNFDSAREWWKNTPYEVGSQFKTIQNRSTQMNLQDSQQPTRLIETGSIGQFF